MAQLNSFAPAAPPGLCCFLLLLLCFAGSVSAQGGKESYAVRVLVKDEATSEPLPFVNVQIANTVIGGMTEADGSYSFRVPTPRFTLLVSSVGYRPYRRQLEVSDGVTVYVSLTPAAETLETVTVSSDDASTRLEQPLMGVERLSIKEIESLPVALGEVDVFRGLQLVSGVNSAGEASNGLSVRGGTIDQNLVLLDGAPVFTPTHLFGLFSVFTPDAVGSVDLYRANIPARFGGRVSSVVDVRTRNPNSDKLKLQGGIGLVSSRLSVETPLTADRRLKVLASARVGLNDFVFRAFERLKNTRSRFADGTLKLRYTAGEKDIISLSGFYSYDFYQIDLINRVGGIIAETNQYKYGTLNGTLEWLRLISDATSVQTRLVGSDHRPTVIFPQLDSPVEVTYDSGIRYLSAQSIIDHQGGNGHHLAGGVQLVHYTLAPGSLDSGGSPNVAAVELADERALEMSAFATDEWQATEALTLSVGLRYTRFLQRGPGERRTYPEGEERLPGSATTVTEYSGGSTLSHYGGLEPRLGLSYALSERSSLKAAYALNRQFLQNIFNSTTPLPSSRWKVADNNVVPQVSQLFSAGIYQLLGRAKRYEASLEGYYRAIDNLLEYKPGADFFLNPTVETDLIQGQGKAYGLELGLRKTAGTLTGQVNYTYARALNRVDGPSLRTTINQGRWYNGYFDQPHTFNSSLTLDDGRTHRLSLNFVVQSNRPYSIPNGYIELNGLTVPIFLERNNARMPVYHRLDFSWTIHNAKMSQRRWVGDWTVTFYNLYGRDNAYNIYYQPRRGGKNSALFGASPLGSYRLSIFGAPVVSLSYSFKFE